MLRPTLEDFVVEMPRGAQVIYPKDLAPICMLGRHRARHAGVRERGRVGRAVDDDAALGRRHRRVRDPRGLRQPGPGERASLPRRRRAGALRRPLGEQLRRDRSRRRTVRPGRARPARAVAGRPARRVRAARRAGSSWPTRRRSRRRRRPASSSRDAGSTPGRSRCSIAAGTSTARPCAPTTAWWPTPASCRSPGSSAGEPAMRAGSARGGAHRGRCRETASSERHGSM